MKDYLTIHINKNTLKNIGRIIVILGAISLFFYMSYSTLRYTFEGSYHDGYTALAEEIKDGMSQTECGNYMILDMKEFKLKLYQEQCSLFNKYYYGTSGDLGLNWNFAKGVEK